MEPKSLRKEKANYVASSKAYLAKIPEIRTEDGAEDSAEMVARLDTIIFSWMSPNTLVKKVSIKEGNITNKVFKQFFHIPLSNDLKNKVSYSAVLNRRKKYNENGDLFFITTYHVWSAAALQPILPSLFNYRLGFDGDLSLLLTDVDWDKEFKIKYNWNEKEITIDFATKKFRGNIVNGEIVGNPI